MPLTMSLPNSVAIIALLGVAAYLLLNTWYPRFARSSLDDLPGPPSDSWIHGTFSPFCIGNAHSRELGNVGEMLMSGEVPSKWPAQYGGVVKVKGAFGVSLVFLALSLPHDYSLRSKIICLYQTQRPCSLSVIQADIASAETASIRLL
jgi:hypothetical protein